MSEILLIGDAGYIGSYLFDQLTSHGFMPDICDYDQQAWKARLRRSVFLERMPRVFYHDYAALTPDDLGQYDIVLWFAGHSTVPMAVADPIGALRNNCTNVLRLRERMQKGARLIYASTGSVYNRRNGFVLPPSFEAEPVNPDTSAYDISKFALDYAAQLLPGMIGLRLGTVFGHSPKMREETAFNAMSLSAMRTGTIKLANAQAQRSFLALQDLWSIVESLIHRENVKRGIFNCLSFNTTMGDLAMAVAEVHGAEILIGPDTPTYSFKMDGRKVTRELGVTFCANTIDTIVSYAAQFKMQSQKAA